MAGAGIAKDFRMNAVVSPGDGTGKELGTLVDREHNIYVNRLFIYGGGTTPTEFNPSGGGGSGNFVTDVTDTLQPAGVIPFASGTARDVKIDPLFHYDPATPGGGTVYAPHFSGDITGANNITTNNFTSNTTAVFNGTSVFNGGITINDGVTGIDHIVQSVPVVEASGVAGRMKLVTQAGDNPLALGLIRGLVVGPNMTIAEAGGLVTLDSLAGGGGGVSSVGGGASLVVDPTHIRSLTSADSSITRTQNANDVNLAMNLTTAGAAGPGDLVANTHQVKEITSTGGSVVVTNTGTTVNLEMNPAGIVQSTGSTGLSQVTDASGPEAPQGQVKTVTSVDNSISIANYGRYYSIATNITTAGASGAGDLVSNTHQIKEITSTGASITITNTPGTVNLEMNPAGLVQSTGSTGTSLVTTAAGPEAPQGQVKTIQSSDSTVTITNNGRNLDLTVAKKPYYRAHLTNHIDISGSPGVVLVSVNFDTVDVNDSGFVVSSYPTVYGTANAIIPPVPGYYHVIASLNIDVYNATGLIPSGYVDLEYDINNIVGPAPVSPPALYGRITGGGGLVITHGVIYVGAGQRLVPITGQYNGAAGERILGTAGGNLQQTTFSMEFIHS